MNTFSIHLMVYLEVTVDLCYFVCESVPFLADKAQENVKLIANLRMDNGVLDVIWKSNLQSKRAATLDRVPRGWLGPGAK